VQSVSASVKEAHTTINGKVQVISTPHVSLHQSNQLHGISAESETTYCSPMAVSVSSAIRTLSVEPLMDGFPAQDAMFARLVQLAVMNIVSSVSPSSDVRPRSALSSASSPREHRGELDR
jgi:hypothetical protein